MASYLAEAVESVFAGSFREVEVVVVNDGSTDDTSSAVKDIKDALDSDKREKLHYVEIDHKGKAAAINQVLPRAKGEYVTILDADDKLPPDSLRLRYERAEETGAELVLGGFSTFDGRRVLGYRPPPAKGGNKALINELLFDIKSPFHQNSMLMAKELIDRVGRYDERLLRAQDKDYAIRLLREANAIEIVDRPVYLYRRYKRGYLNRLKNRLHTIRYKWMVISKHTRGFKKVVALAWGVFIEWGKMGYELFSIYKN